MIPIFFIKVGADFNLPALVSSGSTLVIFPVLLITAFAVKSLPALLFLPFYSRQESLAGGMLLSARLSLIIAAATIGLQLGLITEALNSAIILLAVITCTLAPLMFKWLSPQRPKPRDRIAVIGCRHFVDLLGKRLQNHNQAVMVVCPHEEPGEATAKGDGETFPRTREAILGVLRQIGAERAHTVVALEENDEDNQMICKIAQSVFGVPNLISWVQETTNSADFKALGVRVVNPAQTTLLFIEAMAINPEFYNVVKEIDASVTVQEVKLKKSPMSGKQLKDIDMGEQVTVIGISRGGEWIVPDNQTQLQANDTLSLVGSAAGIEHAVNYLRNG